MKFMFMLLLATTFLLGQDGVGDTLFIATWNVENLFDTVDDPDKKDEDFTPEGFKNWDLEKLSTKLLNLKKVINYMNDGEGPDILAMEEVENETIAKELLDTLGGNYSLVYSESPDGRGIDNCLIYKTDKFTFIEKKAITVNLPDEWPTRDIIKVQLATKNDDTVAVMVNHWPSRSGGQEKSEPNRIAAAKTLKEYLVENNFCTSGIFYIMMGDFNDEPENVSISEKLGAKGYWCDSEITECGLFNLAYQAAKDSLGSYFYRGDWNMLDQIIVSDNIIKKNSFNYVCDSFTIIKAPFMVTADGFYAGAAIPSFGGKKYLAGYSDHFPVGAKFVSSRK